MALTHKWNTLNQLGLNLAFITAHRDTDQMLLNELKTWLVNKCVGVIFITLDWFTFFSLHFFVMSVIMLTVGFLNDVLDQHSNKLSVLKRKYSRASDVLKKHICGVASKSHSGKRQVRWKYAQVRHLDKRKEMEVYS